MNIKTVWHAISTSTSLLQKCGGSKTGWSTESQIIKQKNKNVYLCIISVHFVKDRVSITLTYKQNTFYPKGMEKYFFHLVKNRASLEWLFNLLSSNAHKRWWVEQIYTKYIISGSQCSNGLIQRSWSIFKFLYADNNNTNNNNDDTKAMVSQKRTHLQNEMTSNAGMMIHQSWSLSWSPFSSFSWK